MQAYWAAIWRIMDANIEGYRAIGRAGHAILPASDKAFFDEMTLDLLKKIAASGSVREACQQIGISYSKGWNIIQNAEDGMGCRIVERRPGGTGGGTADVTERGKKLLNLFETYEEQLNQVGGELFEQIFLSGDLF